jgi:hypothetical protein
LGRASRPCVGCGAVVPDADGPAHRYFGASPGCWRLYGEVLGREYADYPVGGYPKIASGR